MTKCNIWVTNKPLSYCSHAGNGRGMDVEYELSCTNTIMARQSCCDDDWVDVSRKPFETILNQNTSHYTRVCVCVCVLLRLNKRSPWTLIISTSEKTVNYAYTHLQSHLIFHFSKILFTKITTDTFVLKITQTHITFVNQNSERNGPSTGNVTETAWTLVRHTAFWC